MPLTEAVPDVLVLVEVSTAQEPADGVPARLGFSGDALNVAAASAAAGARTGLVARIPDDDLGDAIVARIGALGVSTAYLRRGPGQHGVYISHADPEGARQFAYVRKGSFGSTLAPADLDPQLLAAAGVVTASGIAVALSDSAAAAVEYAARHARRFVYDPNYRPRLTTRAAAAERLATIAPLAAVVKPSHPGETTTPARDGRRRDRQPATAGRSRPRRQGGRHDPRVSRSAGERGRGRRGGRGSRSPRRTRRRPDRCR